MNRILLYIYRRFSDLIRQPHLLWVGVFFIVITVGAGLFLFPEISLAVTDAAATQPKPKIDFIDQMLLWAASFIMAAAGAIGQLIVVLMNVMVPLMTYNGFVSSPVIGAGWALVRDSVNMFFVIILIAIAMGTIFGVARFQWKQQITRLMIFAIVINFSRTLCGIMIDFGQVLMLTFANALKDIAGGNMIQMFGLRDAMDVAGTAVDSTVGISAFDEFAAAFIAFGMFAAVLTALIFLTAILAYRIVLLWVLVTIAPLAWFVGGASGVVKSGAYAGWWKRFSCAVSIGPVVTFFLWLALAVAGSGSIASTENFTVTTGEGGVSGSILKSMDSSRMLSFIIGISMLFAGFEAANEVCASVPGMMGSLVKNMTSQAGKVAGAPMAAVTWAGAKASRTGLAAGRGMGRFAYRNTAGRAGDALKGVVAGGLGVLASGAGGGLVPASVRRAAAVGAGKMNSKREAEARQSIEGETPMDKKSLIAYLQSGPPMDAQGRKKYMARLNQAMGDKGVLKDLGPEGLKGILGAKTLGGKNVGQVYGDTFKSPQAQEQMLDVRRRMPNAFGQDAIDDLKPEYLKDMHPDALKDPKVREKVASMKSGHYVRDKNGEQRQLTMSEAIEQNKFGSKFRDGWSSGAKNLANARSPETLASQNANDVSMGVVGGDNFTPDVAVNLASGRNNKDDLRRLGAQSDIKDKLKGDSLDTIKSKGLGIEDDKKRQDFRIGLKVMLEGAGDPGALNKAFDIGEDGSFANEAAAKDFSAAAKKDSSVVAAVDFKKPESEVAQRAVSALGEGGLKNMIKEYEDTGDSGLFDAIHGMIEAAEARVEKLDDEMADIDGDESLDASSKKSLKKEPQAEKSRLEKMIKHRRTMARTNPRAPAETDESMDTESSDGSAAAGATAAATTTAAAPEAPTAPTAPTAESSASAAVDALKQRITDREAQLATLKADLIAAGPFADPEDAEEIAEVEKRIKGMEDTLDVLMGTKKSTSSSAASAPAPAATPATPAEVDVSDTTDEEASKKRERRRKEKKRSNKKKRGY